MTLTGMCVLALILLSGAAMAAELQNGLLVVNSTPGGATIYVDGGLYKFHPFDNATTNSSIYLEPGCYDLYLEKYGYQIWNSRAFLNDTFCINNTDVLSMEALIGQPIILTPLPDNTGTVIITSEPDHAAVFIPALVSGLPVGATTYANGQIPAGVYSFHLEYPGYYPYNGTFTINPGELTHVYAKMARIPTTGFVDFRSDPTDAAIYLNGTDFKHTNQVIELQPGCYAYEFTLAGYFPVNGTFCVDTSYQAENPLPIWRNLTKFPETQHLCLNSTPDGARVWVDGQDTGKDTPNNIELVRAFHTLVFKKPCFKDRVVELNLTQLPAGIFPLDVTLEDLTIRMDCPGMQNGTITPVGGPCVTYLMDKTFNVTAEEGYHITEITFVNNTGTFTQPFTDGRTSTYLYTLHNVTEGGNLCAEFAINVYNVTAIVSSAGSGFIQVSPVDSAWYSDHVTKFVNHGTNLTFNIKNTNGYLFDRYIWNGVTTMLGEAKESYSFNPGPIVSDDVLEVPFQMAEFQVTPLVVGNGTVTPSGAQDALRNGTVCFTAIPGPDSFLGNVTAIGDDLVPHQLTPNIDGKYCVTNITQNYVVGFPFWPYVVHVNSTSNEGGVITSSPVPFINGNVTVPRNTTLTFNAIPDDCHVLGAFTFNGGIIWSNSTTVNVTQNSTITALFAPKVVVVSPELIAPAGTSPTINPSTNVTFYCGGNAVFNVTSPFCYHPNVTLTGASGTTKPTGVEVDRNTWMYNLTNIREDKTFRVAFDRDTEIISTTATGHGTITPLGNTTVPCGSNSTVFTITPESAAYDYTVNVTGYAGGFPADGIFRFVTNDIFVNVTFFDRASPLVDFAAMNWPLPTGPLSADGHVVIRDTNPLNRTVKFFDMTDPSFQPRTWNWDFGDGRYSIEQNPVHTYEAVGTYTVSLTVGNGAMTPGYKQKIYYVIGDMRP